MNLAHYKKVLWIMTKIIKPSKIFRCEVCDKFVTIRINDEDVLHMNDNPTLYFIKPEEGYGGTGIEHECEMYFAGQSVKRMGIAKFVGLEGEKE